ncbi:MAG: IS91 family transposase [Acidobacteriia bacterium]|nr:IS91 family transposase [Terriglobia bacterium]
MSKRPPYEVADVVRNHSHEFVEQYGHLLDSEHLRVLHAIENCRTAILGGNLNACDRCGHRVNSYNSCRNRHCPKCQGAARQKWLANRTAELLPVPYFHVVFTLPHLLAPLALQNKQVLYGILFRAVSETLLEVAADPKHLGAEIGFLTVLHTWGQNLSHHPHIHCVVPGGGMSSDRSRWVGSGDRFLLPIVVLSRLFRGKFLAFLRKAVRQGKLQFHGVLADLATRRGFGRLLKKAYGCEWVVYTKPPFGGPEHVIRYLARYTHRVAISNHRIVSIADGQVTFLWKDYAHGNKQKKMTVAAPEFLRRFFQHVLPKGFVRIRHFGFLANGQRKVFLETCRRLLCVPLALTVAETGTGADAELPLCPACRLGRLHVVERIPSRLSSFFRINSS